MSDFEEKTRKIGEIVRRRNSEMSEILPFLYLGNRLNASCEQQLEKNGIKRILSIHDRPLITKSHPFVENYKFIKMSDTADSDILSVFGEAVEFVHCGRIKKEPVLVHCLMGQSRSATIIGAYLSTFYELDGPTALQFVRQRRKQANPNVGFIMQLNKYAKNLATSERCRILHSSHAPLQTNIAHQQMQNNDIQIINKYCPFAVNLSSTST